jgi:hypothetical protein
MTINLPKVRIAIYVITGILQPVAVYLLATGAIGTLEMALFAAEVTFVSGLAAVNVKQS